MTPFITDRDLLPLEPQMFHELPLAGQTLLRVTDVQLNGTTVTSETGGFLVLQAGQVAILGEGAYPIEEVTDDNTLVLATEPVNVTDTTLIVRTFVPQAEAAHEHLVELLGVGADAIENTQVAARLEALATLSLAYAAGTSVLGDSSRLLEKSNRYEAQFKRELFSAVIKTDSGETIRPATPQMVRN